MHKSLRPTIMVLDSLNILQLLALNCNPDMCAILMGDRAYRLPFTWLFFCNWQDSPACSWTQGFISESYSTWCPNEETISSADPVNYLGLTWTSWAISTIWLFSLERKARSFRWWPQWTKWHSNAARVRFGRIFGNVVYYSSWPVAFGIQFYLVSQYLSNSGFVAPNWAFGQIVAVTIWIPCLIEYLYLEIRKQALPKAYCFC